MDLGRRILGFLRDRMLPVVLALLAMGCAGAVDIALSVDQPAPVSGSTITVTVTLNAAPPFQTWGCQVDFPGNLQLTAIAAGSFGTFVPDARSLSQINSSNEIHLGGYNTVNNGGGSGTLAVLQFLVVNGNASTITTIGYDAGHPFGDILFAHDASNGVPVIDGPLSITARNPDVVSLNAGLTANATESGSIIGNFTVQRQNTVGAITIPLAITGTAVPGTDYLALPSQVVIPNGQSTVAIPIHGLNNAAMLGSQTISIDLLPNSTYTLSTPRFGTALLLDDLGPATALSVDKTTVSVGQTLTVTLSIANAPNFLEWGELIRAPAGMLHLISQSSGDFPALVSDARSSAVIDASSEVHAGGSGSGNSGSGRLGVFTFLVLRSGSILLTAPAQGGGEPFGLALFDQNNQQIIPQAAAPVTVNALPAETITITSPQPTASEVGPTPGYITVSRDRSTDNMTVSLLAGGSSTPGMWVSIPSSVTFAIGQSAVTFPVVPVDDHIVEGTRTLVMTVGPGSLYTVGNPSQVTITRLDADGSDLSLLANTTRPALGGTVTVSVHLDQGPSFSQFGGILKFPVADLALVSQASGAANFGTFVPDARPLGLINSTGEVRMGTFTTADQAGGTGDLVELTFNVIHSGTAVLTTVDQGGGNPFGDALMTNSGLAQLPNISNVLTLQIAPDHAPTAISLTSTHVRQQLPVGTLVGVLSDTDPDVGDYASYALVSGVGSSDNASFTISGNELLTAFSFPAPTTANIRVQATDSGGLTFQATFVITVDAGGTVIYVNPAATGSGNGSSWANAFTDLAPALATAISGNQVWVAAGTYAPTTGTDTTKTLTIASGVAVYGGFAGSEPTLLRSWPANLTTLTGLIGGALHARHVVTLAPGGSLDGVVVTGGDASSAFADQSGGGVLVGSGGGTASISHCIISSNHAAASGGGVCSLGGATAIANCVLDSDVADVGAGAFSAASGSHLLTADTLTNDSGLAAGAVMNTGSAGINVLDCLFDNDSVPALLGGSSVDLVLSSCCLSDGSTSGVVDLGGDVASDPLLVAANSPRGADGIWFTADDGYQESAVSPCRLAGVNAGLIDDLFGAPRPGGIAAVDIGACQFQVISGTAPTITNPLVASGTVGTPFSFTLAASGTAPIAFTAAPLPDGLSLVGTTIQGTPQAAGTTNITLNAANGVGSATPEVLALTIAASGLQPPVITNVLTATAYLDVPFAFPITVSGTLPITIGATPLPQGLSLFGSTIQGAPTVLGTTQVNLTADNAEGIAAPQVLVINVVPPVPAAITSPLTAQADVSTVFSYTITTTGTPVITVGASPLPSWLTLTGNVLAGTAPATDSTSSITLTANGPGGAAAPALLVLHVFTPAVVTSPLSAAASLDAPFTYVPTATGTPTILFDVPTPAQLPPGLSWNATDQAIEGTPSAAGSYPVMLSATNPAGETDVVLTIGVDSVTPPVFTSATAAFGTVGVAFPFQITASGPDPITFTSPDAPPGGLTLDSDGTFSGISTTAGTTVMGITAHMDGVTATQTLTLVMEVPPAITSSLTAGGAMGVAFSPYTITASGTSPVFTASPMPPGLSFTGGTTISGTPTSTGTFDVTITAANDVHTDSQTLVITIVAPTSPVFTSPNQLVDQTTVDIASFTVAAAGTAPITFQVIAGALPGTMSLDGSTGAITGHGTVAGTTPVTIQATGVGTATQVLTVIVQDPPAVNSPSFDSGTVGTPYSYTITSAGSGPFIFDATNLPPGLSVSNGVISGVPTTAAETIIDLSAMNLVNSDARTLDLTIAAATPPLITSASSAAYAVGVPFTFAFAATGSPPITFSTSALPGWLALSGDTLSITGTPPGAGTLPLTITASHPFTLPSDIEPLTLTFQVPATLSSPTVDSGVVGEPYSYTFTANGTQPITLDTPTGMPSWMSYSAGVLSGTPTSPGTFTINLSGQNLLPAFNASLTLTVTPAVAPVITSPASAVYATGAPFTFTFAATGTPPILFSAATLPGWLTLSGDTLSITGTPPADGVLALTITASHPGATSDVEPLTLTFQTPAGITSAASATATVGTPFSYTITASGTLPLTFGASGLAPANLGVDAVSGIISGTPLTSGTFTIPITAANLLPGASQNLMLTVQPATSPIITSPASAVFPVGTPFTFAFAATGSQPITFATSALPGWLALSGDTLSITGTPPAEGVLPLTITASHPGATSAVQTLTLTFQIPATITSPLAASATVGMPFTYTITASGTTPLAFGASALAPVNLGVDTVTGIISGTPLTSGTFTIPITAANLLPGDQQNLTLTVAAATGPVITSPSSAVYPVGAPFTFAFAATGTAPITFSTSALPGWLTLSGDTLSITGTPPAAGVLPLTITASHAGSTPAVQTLTLTFQVPAVVTSPLTASATVGVPFSYTITATGTTPLAFGATALAPVNLSIDALTGILSGTPLANGTFTIPISAGNQLPADTRSLVLTVAPATAPVITSPLSAAFAVGAPFTFTFAASGTQPITFSTSALPGWLTLSGDTLSITGTPPAAGVLDLTITASHPGAASDVEPLSLTFQIPPAITSGLTAAGEVGVPFSYAIQASGTTPLTFAASPLPAGLVVDPVSGVISGTPGALGTTQVLVSATNQVNAGTATVAITIAPGPAPSFTSATSAAATVGQAFSYTLAASGPGPITFATSLLPPGLTFTGGDTISGVPVTSGVSQITLSALNDNGGAQQVLTLNVLSAPVLVSPLTAQGVVGASFTYTIIAGGSAPLTYATSALPAGLTLSGNVISGIPDVSGTGTTPVVLTIANGVGSITPTLSITISPSTAPVITSASTLQATVGAKILYTITASGSGPITFGASPLPAGLSLIGAHLTGSPSASGTFFITLSASNAGGAATPVVLTCTVAPAVAPVITSAVVASGTLDAPFAYTITASGSQPITFGALPLPAGLVRSGQTIFGTPTSVGTTQVTLTAVNAAGAATPVVLSMTITAPAPPVITSALQAQGTVGLPFSYLITAAGTPPITFATSTLPAGLSCNGATISGTPTASGGTAVVVTATDGDQQVTLATLTLTILPQQLPVITSALSATATVGVPFSYTILANGATPITFSASPLPAGLTLSGSVISGIPTTAGVVPVTLSGVNPDGAGADVVLQLTVQPGVAPLITSSDAAVFVVGTPVSFQLTAIGTNPITFATAGLPPGLSVDSVTGLITGTPSSPFSGPAVVVTATNLVSATTQNLQLTVVAPAAPAITSAATATGTVGTPLSFTITASGSPLITVSTSSLPSGLSLSGNVISGTPITAGQTVVQVSAQNPLGTDIEPLLITIVDATAPTITSALAATAVVGTPFTYQITALGSQPIAFQTSGALDALALSANTLSGVPASAGVFPITLMASNAAGPTSQVLTLTVVGADPPVFTSSALATGIGGAAFSAVITASGSQPLVFASADLPAGLGISPTSVSGGISQATLSGILTTTPGILTIDLVASNAGGSAPQAFQLTVLPPPPQIVSFNPPGAGVSGGALVTITGANLQDTSSVAFDGLGASILSTSATAVVVAIPAHAIGFVTATLVTSSGSCTSPGFFGYVPVPTLLTISPNTGSSVGGETITITGTQLAGLPGLNSLVSITFDGLPATLGAISDTSVVLTIPPHPAGAVDVVVTTLAGTFTFADAFTYSAGGGATPGNGVPTTKPESASASACGLGGGGLSLMVGALWWRRRRLR